MVVNGSMPQPASDDDLLNIYLCYFGSRSVSLLLAELVYINLCMSTSFNNYLASMSLIVIVAPLDFSLPDVFLFEKLELLCKKNPGFLG